MGRRFPKYAESHIKWSFSVCSVCWCGAEYDGGYGWYGFPRLGPRYKTTLYCETHRYLQRGRQTVQKVMVCGLFPHGESPNSLRSSRHQSTSTLHTLGNLLSMCLSHTHQELVELRRSLGGWWECHPSLLSEGHI